MREHGLTDSKPLRLPMDPHVKIILSHDTPMERVSKAHWKLIYKTIVGPDIPFPLHYMSQCMNALTSVDNQVGKKVLRYLSSSLS